jgi:hypothetical protein
MQPRFAITITLFSAALTGEATATTTSAQTTAQLRGHKGAGTERNTEATPSPQPRTARRCVQRQQTQRAVDDGGVCRHGVQQLHQRVNGALQTGDKPDVLFCTRRQTPAHDHSDTLTHSSKQSTRTANGDAHAHNRPVVCQKNTQFHGVARQTRHAGDKPRTVLREQQKQL